MNLRIKICGITREEDAAAALEAGADALGFVFHPSSPRHVPPARAATIIASLPPLALAVGVFVDAGAAAIGTARRRSGIDVVQLHGEESPEFCRSIPGRTIKAFRIRKPEDVEAARAWTTGAWLFDAHAEGMHGGTGTRFEWSWLEKSGRDRPVIVAGGLDPDNVVECVRRTRPYALDVSSGVEDAPGIKNADLMRMFVARARRAAEALRTRDQGCPKSSSS